MSGLAAAKHRTGRQSGEGSDEDSDNGQSYCGDYVVDDDNAIDESTSVPRKVECDGGGWPGWMRPELGWSLGGEGPCQWYTGSGGFIRWTQKDHIKHKFKCTDYRDCRCE